MATWLLKNRFGEVTAQQFRTLINDFQRAAMNYYGDYKSPPILSIRTYTAQTRDLMPYYTQSADDISDNDFASMMNILVMLYRTEDIQNNGTAIPIGDMKISCCDRNLLSINFKRHIDDHNALECPVKRSKGRGFLSSLTKLPNEPERILKEKVALARPLLRP